MKMEATEVSLRQGGGTGYAGRVFREIQEVIDKARGQAGALIPVLYRAQSIFGYLPIPVIKTISRDLKIPLSQVYGVISFYNFFTLFPKGKYTIHVCMGTACYVRGTPRNLAALRKDFKLESGETTLDGRFSLDIIRCFGCCALAPIVKVGDDIYQRVTPTKLGKILRKYE
jgi:NADP-reducing hydrogenase subunit HndA